MLKDKTAEEICAEAVAKAVAQGLRTGDEEAEGPPETFVMPVLGESVKRNAEDAELDQTPRPSPVARKKRVKHALDVPLEPETEGPKSPARTSSRKVLSMANAQSEPVILESLPLQSGRSCNVFTGTLGTAELVRTGAISVRIDPGDSVIRYPSCLLETNEACTARTVAVVNVGETVNDIAWFPTLNRDDRTEPAAFVVATSQHPHCSSGVGSCQRYGTLKLVQVGVAQTSCAVAVTAVFRTVRKLGCILSVSVSPFTATSLRLGVVAAGHASGAVGIYSVPRLGKPSEQALTLRPNVTLGPIAGSEHAMITMVEWYRVASNAAARPWVGAVDGSGRVRVWNVEKQTVVASPMASDGTAIQSIAWSPTAPDLLALLSQLGTVTLWNAVDPNVPAAELSLSSSINALGSARVVWSTTHPTVLAIGQPPTIIRRSLISTKALVQLRPGCSAQSKMRTAPMPTCLCASTTSTAFVGTVHGAVITCDMGDRTSRDGDLFTCVQLADDESSDASDEGAYVLRLRTERLMMPTMRQLGRADEDLQRAVRAVACGNAKLMAFGMANGIVAVLPVELARERLRVLDEKEG